MRGGLSRTYWCRARPRVVRKLDVEYDELGLGTFRIDLSPHSETSFIIAVGDVA